MKLKIVKNVAEVEPKDFDYLKLRFFGRMSIEEAKEMLAGISDHYLKVLVETEIRQRMEIIDHNMKAVAQLRALCP